MTKLMTDIDTDINKDKILFDWLLAWAVDRP